MRLLYLFVFVFSACLSHGQRLSVADFVAIANGTEVQRFEHLKTHGFIFIGTENEEFRYSKNDTNFLEFKLVKNFAFNYDVSEKAAQIFVEIREGCIDLLAFNSGDITFFNTSLINSKWNVDIKLYSWGEAKKSFNSEGESSDFYGFVSENNITGKYRIKFCKH